MDEDYDWQLVSVSSPNPDFIRFSNVSKKFGDFVAVDSVSLDIREGEIFCLLGGSGCGKTTLLRMLAGFESTSDGTIVVDGEDMDGVPPERRPINMMFQSYALFPHMTVASNVGYGLRRDRLPKSEINERVAEVLDLVQLTDFSTRRPSQLSGGQRQRVALARCLVKRPKVLLLDEPLGALDKKLREGTQQELLKIQRSLGLTFIVVTHDQEEAMRMADRIGVMDSGRIIQLGVPRELYEQPESLFIADFVGALNSFDGTVLSQKDDEVEIKVEDSITLKVATTYTFESSERTKVTIRPEKLSIYPLDTSTAPTTRNTFEGSVSFVGYMGDQTHYRVLLDGDIDIQINEQNHHTSIRTAIRVGDRVRVDWPGRSTLLF